MKYTHYNYVVGFLLLSMSAHLAAEHYAVVATMETGVNPAGIALTPNNHRAYVANNNNYGIANEDSVTVLDLKHNKPKTTIHDPSFFGPYTVTIDHKGKKAYVTNSNGTTISIIDIKSNTVIGTIDGFNGPSGMVIKPHGEDKNKIAYVNNYGAGDDSGLGNTISVVDLKTQTIIDTIIVDQAPAALTISHNGKYLYVVNYVDGNPGTGTMQVISTENNSVISTTTGFSGPFDIAVKHDGKYAYVTNFGSNNFAPFGTTVSVVSLQPQPFIKKDIAVGIQPAGIAIKPDQHFAFVTNYNTLYAGVDFTNLTAGQGTVDIIDLHSNKVVAPIIAVDQSPANIAVSSDGHRIYVTNYISNTVTVIQKIKDEHHQHHEG